MTRADEIAEELRGRVAGSVTEHAPLGALTTFRVGGNADVLVEPESEEDLLAVADVVDRRLPIAVIGKGSNLLVSDDGFRGVAVRLGRAFRDHEVCGERIRLGAAVPMPAAARLTARRGLAGFEFAAEIPATFGGAVRMNAGAHGREMADVLEWADVVDLHTGRRERLGVQDVGYAYRHSVLQPHQVVTRGQIRLSPDDPAAVLRRIGEFVAWRREHQPPGRSAGSVFRNPTGDAAGRLIEAAGGKGMRCGGAEVSAVHANFIVTRREAKAADVWDLIVAARRMVQERMGVELELEVRLLGTFPEVTA